MINRHLSGHWKRELQNEAVLVSGSMSYVQFTVGVVKQSMWRQSLSTLWFVKTPTCGKNIILIQSNSVMEMFKARHYCNCHFLNLYQPFLLVINYLKSWHEVLGVTNLKIVPEMFFSWEYSIYERKGAPYNCQKKRFARAWRILFPAAGKLMLNIDHSFCKHCFCKHWCSTLIIPNIDHSWLGYPNIDGLF